MADYKKPPLGVHPHWYAHRRRITEINDAIRRYIEYIGEVQHIENTEEYYKLIAMWAKEMSELALLEAKLEMEKRK